MAGLENDATSAVCALLRTPTATSSQGLEGDELFLDVETLGFHGRQVFLIGLLLKEDLRNEEGSWSVIQLFARDYAEEDAIVEAFVAYATPRPFWISFNGKSFDVPFLKTRAAFYRKEIPVPEVHVDLLHGARRVYRRLLPDCRLATLEARVFGRPRVRDLAGRAIPAAYHEYVRTGRGEEIERILEHNRNDLTSLVELHRHLLEG
jgi:uncharacterized protein YprB with RNaseH-like and TPR domain